MIDPTVRFRMLLNLLLKCDSEPWQRTMANGIVTVHQEGERVTADVCTYYIVVIVRRVDAMRLLRNGREVRAANKWA